MKTAVEWLIDKLGIEGIIWLQEELEQAKEMEKEQILKHSVELTKILISNPFEKSGKYPKELVDNYFNETFKQQEQ
jgi:hypothetical protein